MYRYLSLEWIDALSAQVAASAAARRSWPPSTRSASPRWSPAGPEGDVIYHLQLADGAAGFGAGAACPEDVRMEQDWDTAVAVATHQLAAQEAFIKGRIRLTGDQQKLIDAQPVFAALDGVFASVRDHTEYR